MGLNRRELLGAGAVTLLGGGTVGMALGYGPLASSNSAQPGYLDDAPVVYEREYLELRAQSYEVRPGETITFEITHTGPPESDVITLGCGNPWAIQSYEDGEWVHAIWTGGRYANACATGIGPGDTFLEPVPLSAAELNDQPYISEVEYQFEPGTYRFVVIGTIPYLAVNFQILPTAGAEPEQPPESQ